MRKGVKTIINNDITRVRSIINCVKEIKTNAISNYYNSVHWYYSLTDDEKILLESVISLGC